MCKTRKLDNMIFVESRLRYSVGYRWDLRDPGNGYAQHYAKLLYSHAFG